MQVELTGAILQASQKGKEKEKEKGREKEKEKEKSAAVPSIQDKDEGSVHSHNSLGSINEHSGEDEEDEGDEGQKDGKIPPPPLPMSGPPASIALNSTQATALTTAVLKDDIVIKEEGATVVGGVTVDDGSDTDDSVILEGTRVMPPVHRPKPASIFPASFHDYGSDEDTADKQGASPSTQKRNFLSTMLGGLGSPGTSGDESSTPQQKGGKTKTATKSNMGLLSKLRTKLTGNEVNAENVLDSDSSDEGSVDFAEADTAYIADRAKQALDGNGKNVKVKKQTIVKFNATEEQRLQDFRDRLNSELPIQGLMSGYLYKQPKLKPKPGQVLMTSAAMTRTWQKRFFVITPFAVSYYDRYVEVSDTSRNPKGQMQLLPHETMVHKSSQGRDSVVDLEHPYTFTFTNRYGHIHEYNNHDNDNDE